MADEVHHIDDKPCGCPRCRRVVFKGTWEPPEDPFACVTCKRPIESDEGAIMIKGEWYHTVIQCLGRHNMKALKRGSHASSNRG